MEDAPIFRFGLMSDVQYANIEHATNFSGSELRKYRQSAQHAAELIRYWSETHPDLSFIAQLGDLIDGQNAGEYGQGLAFSESQSEQALLTTLTGWRDCHYPTYHAVGNHELYNFSWERLAELLNGEYGASRHQISTPDHQQFYFSWKPAPRWRAVMLCCYEETVIKPRSEEVEARVEALLRAHNPNYGQPAPVNFFAGLSREKERYAPFNGGLGTAQLQWLTNTLREAHQEGERVIVMGHLPLYDAAASSRNIAFDADEALRILGESGVVVAYLAGHLHRGGYARDAAGIHHLTTQAPLTHGYCGATFQVYADRIEVVGVGSHRSYTLDLICG